MRRVLITGASSGIGAATARALAGPGVAMVLHARRSEDALRAVAQEVQAKGATALPVLADLSEAEAPGQPAADRALAGTHHADEHDRALAEGGAEIGHVGCGDGGSGGHGDFRSSARL